MICIGDSGIIELINNAYPLIVTYTPPVDGAGQDVELILSTLGLAKNSAESDGQLTGEYGRVINSHVLKESGEIVFNSPVDRLLLSKDDKIENPVLPEKYALYQNYPNPFNPVTTIGYDLPELSEVKLSVYDLLGRKVVELVSGTVVSGTRHAVWNGRDKFGRPVSSGLYIYSISATSKENNKQFNQNRKLLLLK